MLSSLALCFTDFLWSIAQKVHHSHCCQCHLHGVGSQKREVDKVLHFFHRKQVEYEFCCLFSSPKIKVWIIFVIMLYLDYRVSFCSFRTWAWQYFIPPFPIEKQSQMEHGYQNNEEVSQCHLLIHSEWCPHRHFDVSAEDFLASLDLPMALNPDQFFLTLEILPKKVKILVS